jgi:hypothetical protein
MKRAIICILVLLPGLVLLAGTANAQSSKDAYKALKKLEARTQAGISYKDYGPALGDAKVEVNMFSESAEAKEKPRLKEIFNKAMGHYEEAGNVWRYQFAGRGAPPYMVSPDDSAMINQIMRYYPSIRTKVKSTEFDEPTSYDDFKRGIKRKVYRESLSYSDAIKAIWQEASEELKKAGPLLN